MMLDPAKVWIVLSKSIRTKPGYPTDCTFSSHGVKESTQQSALQHLCQEYFSSHVGATYEFVEKITGRKGQPNLIIGQVI